VLPCPLSFGARATEPNSRASAPTAKDSIYGESGSHGILALLLFSRLGKKAAYHCIKKKNKSFTTPQLHVDCNHYKEWMLARGQPINYYSRFR